MFHNITPEFKKEMVNAHYEYCLKHRWGDPNNAGKNYVPKKKKKSSENKLTS